ncbi:DUF3142 domain-containing protein [Kiloniella antarctica]|uniref:DUF3142 domain-containing protein n=1 Tax=Kiloniella antarctica TaxID=1550907 RepID=A0ABW5BCZ7_9PROT
MKEEIRFLCRSALLWGVIFSSVPVIGNLRAQEVDIDYWVWAGQSHTDISKSEHHVLTQCEQQKYHCRINNPRVLVRSWTGEKASLSIKHNSPRQFDKSSLVILSYRLENLVDDKEVGAIIQRDINIWRRAERPVATIEIDYDSPSAGLEEYRQWLVKLKSRLRGGMPLSITGLPTWFEDNHKQAIKLAGSVNEVSLMFYRQERTPITQHLLSAIRRVNNVRYAFLCDDNRWEALVRERKKNETFRMAIFLLSRCIGVGDPDLS